MKYYPAFLNLREKKVVVVGGGKVAERKVRSLLDAQASVMVLSPQLSEGLKQLRSAGLIRHIRDIYRKRYITGAFLVIAATSSASVNSMVGEEAPFLVNVVDVPKECNFIVPSLVRRGSMVIAISTEGVSPALSKAVRRELEVLYGSSFVRYIDFLRQTRVKALEGIKDAKKRESFLKGLVSPRILAAVRKGDFASVKEKLARKLERLLA